MAKQEVASQDVLTGTSKINPDDSKISFHSVSDSQKSTCSVADIFMKEQFILPDSIKGILTAKTEAKDDSVITFRDPCNGELSDITTESSKPEITENKLILHKELELESCQRIKSENFSMYDGDEDPAVKQLPCGVCGEMFLCENTLVNHLTVHGKQKNDQHLCILCLKTFKCKQSLANHMNIHTGVKLYTCNICSKSFRHKSNLTVHLKIHTGIKLEKCNLCSKAFHNRSDLRSHMRVHTNERPHPCPRCFRRFSRAYDLKLHLRRLHTNEKPFNCESCNNCFATISELKTHGRRNQCKPKKPKSKNELVSRTCLICYKEFSKKIELDMHLKLHLDVEIPLEQDVAQQMSVHATILPEVDPINRNNMVPEMQVSVYAKILINSDLNTTSNLLIKQEPVNNETTLKPVRKSHPKLSELQISKFHCLVCLKSFSCNQTLKSHMNIHTGEKLYTCSVCSKAFRHKSNLTVHMKIHTEVKREKCNLCSQAFHNRSDLRSHMRVHTNERPHVCPQCFRRFSRAYDLKLHIRRLHTKEKPFTCDSCANTFASVSDLKMHVRRNQCKGVIQIS